MKSIQRRINLQYAIVQGFYWMSYCGAFSFAAVYLQYRGYSNTGLGLVVAAGCIAGFLLPQALAALIDRSERVTVFHCLWALLALQVLILTALLFLPGHTALVSVLYALYLCLVTAVNPMNTQMSLELEFRFGHINYGAARGTGSLAFVPVSILLGILLERRGAGLLPVVNLLCLAAQLGILLCLDLSVRADGAAGSVGLPRTHNGSSTGEFIRNNRRFFLLMLGTALIYFAHNLMNNFMINVVNNVGGDTSDMGMLHGYIAALEIPVMFLYDRLTHRISCAMTLRIAVTAFFLKALAVALATSMAGLYAACALQALSFALLTPAIVRYVNLYVDHRDSAKGQALAYGMVTLGNVFSSSIGGILFDALSVRQALLVGAAVALLGMLICQIYTERKKNA